MTNAQLNIQWEEHSRLHESYDDCDPAEFAQMLGEQFPDIAFRVDFYEGDAWLRIDASQPSTRKYDIRRWLRDNGMLNRYSDDDGDDRAYWQTPKDYQPAATETAAL